MARLRLAIGLDIFMVGQQSPISHFSSQSINSHIDRIPGDIKWLARVVKAETKLASNDIFGQVSSGTLTLTGLLGVFRINKEGIEPPHADNDTVVPTEGW